MRRAAPLILLAFVAILAVVGRTYYIRLKRQAASAPVKPRKLDPGTEATFHGWNYTHTSSEKTVVRVHADDFQELDGKYELTGVTLDIFNKDGKKYHHVESGKAEFDVNKGTLYSDGEVKITMNIPEGEQPTGRLMEITSTGVSVEAKTGKTNTDRPATFKFDRGDGQAIGLDYDPDTRVLNLHNNVSMTWRGTDPGTTPMTIETAQLNYNEHDQKIYLTPWSKLSRDTLMMNAGPATVTINKGNLKLVETTQAIGTDRRPSRNLDFAANQLAVEFNDYNQIQKMTGVDQARVVSHGETSNTTLTSDRVVMDFQTTDTDSLLQEAVAQGHGLMRSDPVTKPGADPADTRVLTSDTIRTKMRPNGQEIDSVETDGPGSIEIIPNTPAKPHRWIVGAHIWMTYGPKNEIQSFRSVSVTTRTQKPKAKDSKEEPAPAFTSSRNLAATFLPNSSNLDKVDQSGDFHYREGDRQAKADRALLDQPNNIMNLIGSARMWDATGSANADKILINQTTGDFTAEGHVNSTRKPDQPKADAQGGGMLDKDEPLFARANKMISKDNNLDIRYEGNAVVWQGADRLEADVIEIDRDKDLLMAHGNVTSQLLDKVKEDDSPNGKADGKPQAKEKTTVIKASKPDPKADGNSTDGSASTTKARLRVFTTVKSSALDYNDDTRVAHYSGGATLERSSMIVKAQDIHAFLRNDSDDSSLDHAFADGHVDVHEVAVDRTRDAHAEHAEYYVDEDKVILEGGQPQFSDSSRGTTRGQKLTWYSSDDRLVVNGKPQEPVKSVMHKKTVAK